MAVPCAFLIHSPPPSVVHTDLLAGAAAPCDSSCYPFFCLYLREKPYAELVNYRPTRRDPRFPPQPVKRPSADASRTPLFRTLS